MSEASPDERGFVAALRTHAPMYIRTVMSGASKHDVALLREIIGADEQTIDEFRPFGMYVNPTEGRAPWEDLENARTA